MEKVNRVMEGKMSLKKFYKGVQKLRKGVGGRLRKFRK